MGSRRSENGEEDVQKIIGEGTSTFDHEMVVEPRISKRPYMSYVVAATVRREVLKRLQLATAKEI